jgi:hypothetical protein
MRIQMSKKEEDCEKLKEEVILLRVEVENLNKKLKKSPVLDKTGFGHIGETSYKQDPSHNKNVEETRSPTQPVEEKYSRLPERKNEEKVKSYMQKYLKEGIMVNKSPRGMIHFQEDHLLSDNKEDSTMIVINQGMNSEGLHHREDHLLPGIKVSFMVTVFIVLTLDIKL